MTATADDTGIAGGPTRWMQIAGAAALAAVVGLLLFVMPPLFDTDVAVSGGHRQPGETNPPPSPGTSAPPAPGPPAGHTPPPGGHNAPGGQSG